MEKWSTRSLSLTQNRIDFNVPSQCQRCEPVEVFDPSIRGIKSIGE